jgi:hypothetical protein
MSQLHAATRPDRITIAGVRWWSAALSAECGYAALSVSLDRGDGSGRLRSPNFSIR